MTLKSLLLRTLNQPASLRIRSATRNSFGMWAAGQMLRIEAAR
jgi:hypothetical protein